jgi:glycosyltransferase involved in cell wall biosynthesis
MRILIIIHNNHLYGANRSLLTLIEYLNSQPDTELTVLTPGKGDMHNVLCGKNIKCIAMPYFSMFLYLKPRFKYFALPFLFIVNLISFPFITYKVQKMSSDIIYSNTAAENIGILLSKILKIKHIWHIREFMDQDYDAYFIGGKRLKDRYINQSDGLIFVSKAIANTIPDTGKNLRKIIYNGIELKNTTNFKKSENKFLRLGVVGVIDPAKGQKRALLYFSHVIKGIPNLQLHFYGANGGRYEKELRRMVQELHLQDIVFFNGFVSEVNEIYKNIDILLMMSRSEGFGRVTVEAMLSHVPVIGFKTGGTPELVTHGETGFLFSNEKQFKDSILSLTDKNVYDSIVLKAYNEAVDRFNVNLYKTQVADFINNVFNI